VVRRDGTTRMRLTRGPLHGFGLAWSPDGREVWYTGSDTGSLHLSLFAVDLKKRRRLIAAMPALVNVLDVASDGRALLSIGDLRGDVVAWAPGDPHERLLSWLDFPRSVVLSPDGRSVVFSEGGQGAGSGGAAVYARGIDGSPAVRLGEGWALDVSPDGRFVVALGHSRSQPSHELEVIPTGPGETRTLAGGELEYRDARWLPAGDDELLAVARRGAADWRLWLVGEKRSPQPVTPEGFGAGAPSPDGRSFVAQRIEDGALFLFAGGAAEGRPLPGPAERGRLISYSRDGRSLLVAEPLVPGTRIARRDLATGARTPIRDLTPEDPAGISLFDGTVSRSEDTFAAAYVRATTALFLARGLR
jgi:hypothetical protein